MNGFQAICAQGLGKDFSELRAVEALDLTVRAGEIYGLLGPNGAGKSTVISMLSCLLRPTRGDALVMGHSIIREPMAVKATIGVVPQEVALYADMTVRENLAFWGKMHSLRGGPLRTRIDEVLEIIGLAERQKGVVARLSGGMKRRLNLGIALLHEPQVVIMDEPTVGIDPQSRRSILDGVQELNRRGTTILYTTHYMEEAQELSHRIGIMDRGRVIAQGTHHELVKIVGELDRIEVVAGAGAERLIPSWRGVEGVRQVSAENGKLTLLVDGSDLVLPRLFEAAARAGARITAVEIREPNLEAAFLHLTGRALRDA